MTGTTIASDAPAGEAFLESYLSSGQVINIHIGCGLKQAFSTRTPQKP